MYVMGFDYGSKRIGVAVGQTLTATARPLAIVSVKNQRPDWARISTLIQEWQPDALVVGLPKYADGSDSAITVAARRFSRQLQERYQLPIHTIDETLSSVAAAEKIPPNPPFSKGGTRHYSPQRHQAFPPFAKEGKVSPSLKKGGRGDLDAIAAQIILETWFAECP